MSESKAKQIKALLTKAEGTKFQEESDAFYAKAAELMAKYAIDQAQLDALAGQTREQIFIEKRRYVVQAPYSMDRLHLIVNVSSALGGYAYFFKQPRDGSKTRTRSKDHDTYSVLVGTKEDLDQIEVMLESLNRQMEHAREIAQSDQEFYGGMGQKKVWNATFIRSYAYRIGQRLKESYDAVIDTQTGSVAIVLRDKKIMLKEELAKIGLGQPTKSTRQYSSSGAAAGRLAADRSTIRKSIG